MYKTQQYYVFTIPFKLMLFFLNNKIKFFILFIYFRIIICLIISIFIHQSAINSFLADISVFFEPSYCMKRTFDTAFISNIDSNSNETPLNVKFKDDFYIKSNFKLTHKNYLPIISFINKYELGFADILTPVEKQCFNQMDFLSHLHNDFNLKLFFHENLKSNSTVILDYENSSKKIINKSMSSLHLSEIFVILDYEINFLKQTLDMSTLTPEEITILNKRIFKIEKSLDNLLDSTKICCHSWIDYNDKMIYVPKYEQFSLLKNKYFYS